MIGAGARGVAFVRIVAERSRVALERTALGIGRACGTCTRIRTECAEVIRRAVGLQQAECRALATLAVAIAGTLGVAITYSSYDADVSTRSEYDSLTAWNTVSWVGAGVGLASFSVSYLLVPKVDEKEVSSRSKGGGGLHGVGVQGSF